jgi:hypothetical protein
MKKPRLLAGASSVVEPICKVQTQTSVQPYASPDEDDKLDELERNLNMTLFILTCVYRVKG